MIRIIILLVVVLFPISGLCQPLLAADPCGDSCEYFILTIDDGDAEEIIVFEEYDWMFFKDLSGIDLEDGFHKMELKSYDAGLESMSIVFFIEVGTYEGFRRYEIVPDPENSTFEYQAKFDPRFAVADVYDDGRVVVSPKPEEPSDGNANCFIGTVGR